MANISRLYSAANCSLRGDVYERAIDRITETDGSIAISDIYYIFKSELRSMDLEEVFTTRKDRWDMDLFVIADENVHPNMVGEPVMGEIACYDVELACEITIGNGLQKRYFRIFTLQPRNPVIDDYGIVISRSTPVVSHDIELRRSIYFRGSSYFRHVSCNREFAERYC